MRTLYLDLASHDGLLACVDERRIVASRAIDHRIGDHELIPIFERVLHEAQWKQIDLTHVACVIGPGGFMSLRVAVAFANTLTHALAIPGAGVHLSEMYAARVGPHPALRATLSRDRERESGKDFFWLHSTKKHELFVRGFGEMAHVWPEAAVTSLDKLTTHHSRLITCSWIGELLPEHAQSLATLGWQPLPLQPIAEILPSFLAAQRYESKLLEPWYGRMW